MFELLEHYAPEDRSRGMLRLNMITSLDGAATLGGRSGPLGGAADQAVMRLLRKLADVIIVGASTVRIEGYQGDLISREDKDWRVAQGLSPHPLFEVAHLSGLPELVRRHAGAQILCEGGPHIFGALAAMDAIDELCLTVGPVLAGPGAGRITAGLPHPLRPMRLIHAIPVDDLVFLRYQAIVTDE